jgi:putative membrane protein
MNVLLRWVIGAVALFLTVKMGEALGLGLHIASGSEGLVSAFAVILVLTLVNAFIRPVVLFFFSGLNCLTLGLFSFVVNALMFWLVSAIAQQLRLGFRVDNFIAALFGSIALSVITGILGTLLPDKSKDKDKR